MSSKTLATKVSEDSELYRSFDDYADDYSSKSEALRVAIRRGMEDDRVAQLGERGAWGVLSLSIAGLALDVGVLAGVAAVAAAVLFIGTGVYRWRAGQ